MEEWQKTVIQDKLPSLITCIDCNVVFLSELLRQRVISETDEEIIDSLGTYRKIAKAKKLLDILKTRVRGFECLAIALHCTKQTGALFTLLEGAEYHVDDKSAFQVCGIEINSDEVLSKAVLFEDFKVSLEDLCCNIDKNRLVDIIKKYMDVDTYKKLMYGDGKEVTELVYNTVPTPISYYIPRTITLKSKLDPSIFHRLDADVFLIEGIHLHQLTVLATGPLKEQTDTSRNQILRLTVRFILLEEEAHFHKIVALSKVPVHWIKYENDSYIYIKSNQNGGTTRVQEFLRQKADQLFSEDAFLDMSLSGPRCHVYLLYESPGMGKTLLLAEFARKVKAMSPQGNTVFISASHLVGMFEKKAELNGVVFRNKLANFITKNKLGAELQIELFTCSNHSIHLFVDGFDEIPKSDIQHAREIIYFILNKMENIRLYVTTRPHYKVELEDLFGTSGYNILPFLEIEQVLFFTSYWHKQHHIPITDNISDFAKNCIQTFNSTVTVEDRSLAGIPLQCKMLAELYLENARKNTLTLNKGNLINSIYKMYKRYIYSRFEMCKHIAEREALYNFHVGSAINLIFPGKLNLSFPAFTENLYRFGIMEESTCLRSKPTFVHRSFAEFLAAEAILNWCRFKPPNEVRWKSLTKFVINELFETQTKFEIGPTCASQFYHLTVARFFEMGFIENLLNWQDLAHIAKIEAGCSHQKTLFNLLKASLANDSITLFNLFQKLLPSLEILHKNRSVFTVAMSKFYGLLNAHGVGIIQEESGKNDELRYLVSISAKLCSANLVKNVCDFLFEVSGKHFHELEYSRESSPVYLALQRGDYQVVEYLLIQSSPAYFSTFYPLNALLTKSYFDEAAVIEQKQQIIQLLLKASPEHFNLNSEYRLKTAYFPPPLLSKDCHLQLIKCLIKSGADLAVKHSEKFHRNVLHLVSGYFSPSRFDEFVKFLFDFDNAGACFLFDMRDYSVLKQKPIHRAALLIELQFSTMELLQSHNVKLDATSSNQKTILHYAVAGKRSVAFLKFLIEKEYCPLESQDGDGDTFLHLLPFYYGESDYIEILEHLIHLRRQDMFFMQNNKLSLPIHCAVHFYEISKKTLNLFKSNSVDFNSTHKNNDSLLMEAARKKSLSTIKTLVSLGVDIMAQNSEGYTVAHIAAFKSSAEEFHDFVEFVLSLPHDDYQPKQIFEIKTKTKFKSTPIHIAVNNIELHFSTLELLHTHNVKLGIISGKKTTILQHAVTANRSLSLLKFIIDKGYCLLESQNCDGDTFLHCLPAYYGEWDYLEIVEYLVKTKKTEIMHNALLTLSNKEGETSLHIAVYYHEVLPKTLDIFCGTTVRAAPDNVSNEGSDIIGSLCDINAVTCDGYSVLFYAILYKRGLRLVKDLISRGADWKYQNNHNTTALLLAARFSLLGHVEYFIELGSDIHDTDNDGDNALHCAVVGNNEDVVDKVNFLILKGVNKWHKNKEGNTPYMIAMEKGIEDEIILSALQTDFL